MQYCTKQYTIRPSQHTVRNQSHDTLLKTTPKEFVLYGRLDICMLYPLKLSLSWSQNIYGQQTSYKGETSKRVKHPSMGKRLVA